MTDDLRVPDAMRPLIAELVTRLEHVAHPEPAMATAVIATHLASDHDDRWLSIATLALAQLVDNGYQFSRHVVMPDVFLMYAFRYALGRQSYAVSDVAGALVANRDHLTSDRRRQIIRDINDAIAEDRAGAATDVARWQQVAEAMR